MSCASGYHSECSSITLSESAQARNTSMNLIMISAAICLERLTRPRHTARAAKKGRAASSGGAARAARTARAARAARAAGIFPR